MNTNTYTFTDPDATKVQLLWSNLIHYANFGHAIHPAPEVVWVIDITDIDGELSVRRAA